MNKSVSKPVSQPVTQQVSKTVSETINKSASWLVINCKSANSSVGKSVSHSTGQPFSESMRQ